MNRQPRDGEPFNGMRTVGFERTLGESAYVIQDTFINDSYLEKEKSMEEGWT